jgi:hypothetical protein
MTAVPLSSLPAAATQGRLSRAWLLPIISIAALIPRIGFLARPFESDSGLYVYMGKVLVEGQQLYHDFYETKTPGVALLTAPLFRLFGHHWWPYVFLQAAMTLVAAWLLAAGISCALHKSARQATFAFAVVFLNFSLVAYRGFQLETIQCFFASLAGGIAMVCINPNSPRPRVILCLLTGLFAGAAAMLKPTGGAVAAAFILTLVFSTPRQLRSIPATIAGLLVVPGLVLLWTIRAGLLGDMPALLHEIALYGSGTPIVGADWIKPFVVLVVGGLPFLFVRICRTGVNTQSPSPSRSLVLFAWSWLLLELAGVVLQKRMYIYHFLPLAMPLAVLFGIACRNRRPLVYAIALAPIVLLSVFQTKSDFAILIKSGIPNLPESDYLLAHAGPGDTVVGDPLERVLMETHLRCGARYAHLFYFMNHDDAPLQYVHTFLADLDRNQPQWAVFRTDSQTHRLMQCRGQTMLSENPIRKDNFLTAWHEIDIYLETHYTPVANAGEMTIYKRR